MSKEKLFACLGAYICIVWSFAILFPEFQMTPPIPMILFAPLLFSAFAGPVAIMRLGINRKSLGSMLVVLGPALLLNMVMFAVFYHKLYPLTNSELRMGIASTFALSYGIWCMLRARWPERFHLRAS